MDELKAAAEKWCLENGKCNWHYNDDRTAIYDEVFEDEIAAFVAGAEWAIKNKVQGQ